VVLIGTISVIYKINPCDMVAIVDDFTR